MNLRNVFSALATATVIGLLLSGSPSEAQNTRRSGNQGTTFNSSELIDSGHKFFGTVSRDLGQAVQEATKRWGTPNGYILGQEASGAFVGGLRYGEGILYTRNGKPQRIYLQGPSVGFDWGGDGGRSMILVYNMRSPQTLHQRFAGVNGSAYLVGGFGFTALTADHITLVPIRSGVGVRLGVNLGYLKITPSATWNPF